MAGVILVVIAVTATFLLEKKHIQQKARSIEKFTFYSLLTLALVTGILESFQLFRWLPNPTLILTFIYKPVYEVMQSFKN